MKKIAIIGTCICFIILIIGWAIKLRIPSHDRNLPALPPHSFYLFKLTSSDARIPCLQVEIEGLQFQAKLDMGYEGVINLPSYLLEQLTHKYDAGTVFVGSIKGNKYETRVFTIPKLYIENLSLVNVPADESNLEFERDTSLRTKKDLKSSDIYARIGWQAFLGTVLLIDLKNSTAVCSDSLETLNENGYPMEQFVSTDLFSGKQCMEFEAEISNRIVKCLLDTGCTINLIQTYSATQESASEFADIDFANPLPPTSLSVGGRHLGPCTFHETQLPFGAEAIIGVDFLETQIICIDFIHRKLYLLPIPQADSLNPI